MRNIFVSARSEFLSALGAAAGAAALPLRASAQVIPLRVASSYSDLFAEPFYAKPAGAFAKAGFDVDATVMTNAAGVVAAIGGGGLDLGIGDMISGVNAIIAGVPIVLLAGGALYVSSDKDNQAILGVANASPIQRPQDLVGRTISVPTLAGLAATTIRAWLSQHGIALDSVKLFEMPTPAALAALLRGTTDCALLGEPFLAQSRGLIRDIGHPYDAVAKEFLISAWYASKSWVEADKARARRAVAAIYDTARWANTHHAETLAILVEYGKLDPERSKVMLRAPYATSMSPALIQPMLDVATQYKIFDRAVDARSLLVQL